MQFFPKATWTRTFETYLRRARWVDVRSSCPVRYSPANMSPPAAVGEDSFQHTDSLPPPVHCSPLLLCRKAFICSLPPSVSTLVSTGSAGLSLPWAALQWGMRVGEGQSLCPPVGWFWGVFHMVSRRVSRSLGAHANNLLTDAQVISFLPVLSHVPTASILLSEVPAR